MSWKAQTQEQLRPSNPVVMEGIGSPEDGYYCHDVSCGNCRKYFHIHIRKGVIQKEHFAECDRCGVSVNLFDGSVKP